MAVCNKYENYFVASSSNTIKHCCVAHFNFSISDNQKKNYNG